MGVCGAWYCTFTKSNGGKPYYGAVDTWKIRRRFGKSFYGLFYLYKL